MKYRNLLIAVLFMLAVGIVFVQPCSAQYREYYFHGKVVDTEDQPLGKVQILLRDVRTSRGYKVKTNKKGEFKFAGLPHGVYKVTMTKKGYKDHVNEWRFETPQNRMQKVEIEKVIMVSETKFQQVMQARDDEAGFKTASEKIKQGDFAGALVLLEPMQKTRPEDANIMYLMGVSYLNTQKLPEATAKFLKITELTPDFAGAFYHLGICYQRAQDGDKALAAYKKGLELKPDHFPSLYNVGLILYGLNKTAEAIPYFERALAVQPDMPDILEMVALSYLRAEKYAKSLEYLEKAKAAAKDPEKIKSLDELIEGLKSQIPQK